MKKRGSRPKSGWTFKAVDGEDGLAGGPACSVGSPLRIASPVARKKEIRIRLFFMAPSHTGNLKRI
jgi:hypothetical protein